MGDIKYTDDQLKVINARDCNILVSAAAGSGKTTVLVERIIRRVIDEKIDIDRILVLTFTNAAATDMRAKIEKAIAKKLDEYPDDEHLIRQSSLIYNAQITTIHSFCLFLLKNNFATVGVEPGFRIADENELVLMKQQLLDETIEEFLESDLPGRDELFARFVPGDKLSGLKEAIENTYANACNAPFIDEYIEERRSDYGVATVEELEGSQWIQSLLESCLLSIKDCRDAALRLEKLAETEGITEYEGTAAEDAARIEELLEHKKYAEIKSAFDIFEFSRLSTKKGSSDAVTKEMFKNARGIYKDKIIGLKEKFFAYTLEEILERMKANAIVVEGLCNIVALYHEKIEAEKRNRKIITFSDMEHYALKILYKKEDGIYVPSDTAIAYRLEFDEIMIDEYQDSNYIQERILSAISKDFSGGYNRFMVGDVKQSIYRFRNANPELFLEKYKEYSKEEGAKLHRIDLSMNYRSRKEVVDSVNAIFRRIMIPELGGLTYDDAASLKNGAQYVEKTVEGDISPDKTEFLILRKDTEDTERNKYEQEAYMIASRIKKLMAGYKVQNEDGTGLRDCKYTDIVILIRSGNGMDEALKSVLEQEGIPAYITTKSGYFDRMEILVLLDYLKLLNNPGDDIALGTVLKSVYGDMNDSNLAILKILSRRIREKAEVYGLVRLFDQLREVATLNEENIEDIQAGLEAQAVNEVVIKSRRFLDMFDKNRAMVPYTSITGLLETVIGQVDYFNQISVLPAGEQRLANVQMLLRKAENFENSGFKGLYNFVTYIDKLRKYGVDEGDAIALDEKADVVRIMTMHKSKGLEFPICIVAGLGKGFNTMDSKDDIVFHNRLGLGLHYVDDVRRTKVEDMRKNYIVNCMRNDAIAEEIRVLYVALTRAKEKLIMTGCITQTQAKQFDGEPRRYNDINGIETATQMEISKKDSFLSMILLARGGDDWGGQCELKEVTLSELKEAATVAAIEDIERKAKLQAVFKEGAQLPEEIKLKVGFEYPHKELTGLTVKTNVSELKIEAINRAIAEGDLYDVPETFNKVHKTEEYVPSFAKTTEEEASGTTRGTAYHRCMELMDFEKSPSTFKEQMLACIEAGSLSREYLELVNEKKIGEFLNSELAARMGIASSKGLLYREQPFVLGVSADRRNSSFPKEETMLVQGIIDVFFEEEDGIVLMDYKTDAVDEPDELIKRYKTQLDYYAEAIEHGTGKKVKEILIYSFRMGKTLRV